MDRFKLGQLKNAVEEVKSKVQPPKNDTEKRVQEALSNKNWGASSTLMNEIAQDTYRFDRYDSVMNAVWKAMDSNGRNWRIVFKALTLLEHLVKNGAERCVADARDRSHKIRTLQDFAHHEGQTDRGNGVREKAKALIELLSANEIIREERQKAAKLRVKFQGIGRMGASAPMASGFGSALHDTGNYGRSAQQLGRDAYGGAAARGAYSDKKASWEDENRRRG